MSAQTKKILSSERSTEFLTVTPENPIRGGIPVQVFLRLCLFVLHDYPLIFLTAKENPLSHSFFMDTSPSRIISSLLEPSMRTTVDGLCPRGQGWSKQAASTCSSRSGSISSGRATGGLPEILALVATMGFFNLRDSSAAKGWPLQRTEVYPSWSERQAGKSGSALTRMDNGPGQKASVSSSKDLGCSAVTKLSISIPPIISGSGRLPGRPFTSTILAQAASLVASHPTAYRVSVGYMTMPLERRALSKSCIKASLSRIPFSFARFQFIRRKRGLSIHTGNMTLRKSLVKYDGRRYRHIETLYHALHRDVYLVRHKLGQFGRCSTMLVTQNDGCGQGKIEIHDRSGGFGKPGPQNLHTIFAESADHLSGVDMPGEIYPLHRRPGTFFFQVGPLRGGIIQIHSGHAERVTATQDRRHIMRIPYIVHYQCQILLPPGQDLINTFFPFLGDIAGHSGLVSIMQRFGNPENRPLPGAF
eukprot:TRINITY_DN14396_c0_g2_i1.p1 TRINITY_DN14396_c0_g2~~TRINITY_DN14396_c0_g2_i1.p1  ORF type:complete len:474 (+),score=35.75 TRINITY_DN14396_c0_g2_i1:190-1611(+)